MNSNNDQYPSIKKAYLVVVFTFFLFILIGGILGGWESKVKLLLVELITIVPALYFVLVGKYEFRKIFRWQPVSPFLLLISLFIGIGLSILLDEVDRLIQMKFPMSPEILNGLNSLLMSSSVSDSVVLFLTIVLIAGFAEEMLFRGFFQSVLEHRFDVTKAVMVTALVFAFVHFNPWWFVEILILGVLLGVMSWKSGSIFPCVVVHGVNNLISLVFVNSTSEQLNWYLMKGHVSPVLLVIALGCVVLGFRLFYRFTD